MSIKSRFKDRGKRLKKFYLSHWKQTKHAFAAALNINETELDEAFQGHRDPLVHAPELVKLGIDLNWLTTGEYLNGMECTDAARLLKAFGVCDYYDLYQLLAAKERCMKCGNKGHDHTNCAQNAHPICLN
jgi:hypothetical protein